MSTQIQSMLHVAKMTGVAGMENHLLTLLPGLKARGLNVSLLILTQSDRPMDAYAARMIGLGVPTAQTPIRGSVDLALYRRLLGIFRSYDAVHTHLIHADLHGILAARHAGVRHIYTTGHNDDPFRRRLPFRLSQALLWRQVTHGIAISDSLRQFQIAIEGASPARVTTIHYGLDVNPVPSGDGAREMTRRELGLPLQAPVVGSVCRLVAQKGISDGLRAFWQIAQQVPDAHYVIVGDGPLRSTLAAEADGYGLQARVHFLGWRDDARALMAAFDVLLSPSHWEGFGLVLLEAMAARVPVIATRVSAIPEIVRDGETGYLTAPADVQALSQALLKLLSDPTAVHQMGAAGRDRLETAFSAARMIDQTLAVYNT